MKAGVDGWWPDEGDRRSVYARLDRNRMYWEGSRKTDPTRRPFALHRNGYAGLQRYGWLWSGDTFSTWNALKAQIMVGINVGLSGIPYWGTATGGFTPCRVHTRALGALVPVQRVLPVVPLTRPSLETSTCPGAGTVVSLARKRWRVHG